MKVIKISNISSVTKRIKKKRIVLSLQYQYEGEIY